MTGPTDVLAFPMAEGPFTDLAPDCLGDVVITAETALRQARRGDLRAECALLLVHGILHLLIIKNKAAPSVEFGLLSEDVLNVIKYLPGNARGSQDSPLVSPELYNRKFIKFGAQDTVIWLRIRGVTPVAFEVYPQVTLIKGRPPRRGEILIGKEVAVKFGKDFAIGDTLQVGKENHLIAGIFTAGGSTFEGEIWMDKKDMKLDFDMHGLSQVTVRLESPLLKDSFIRDLNHNQQLPMADAIGEKEYFASEAATSTFVLVRGIIIANSLFYRSKIRKDLNYMILFSMRR